LARRCSAVFGRHRMHSLLSLQPLFNLPVARHGRPTNSDVRGWARAWPFQPSEDHVSNSSRLHPMSGTRLLQLHNAMVTRAPVVSRVCDFSSRRWACGPAHASTRHLPCPNECIFDTRDRPRCFITSSLGRAIGDLSILCLD
jgi:hypothetical protein